MKKSMKIAIGIFIALLSIWVIIFSVNYNRALNLNKPILTLKEVKQEGEKNKTICYGLGYRFEFEEENALVGKEEKRVLTKSEMYMFNKVIAASIADLNKEELPEEIEHQVEDKDKVSNTSNENNNDIVTALTLEDKIQNNSIWCGTFQIIWNDLKNDLAKQDIVFTPQLDVVKNLNKETFTERDLSEEYFYKKIGKPSLDLKEEIEKDIKKKFDEKSDILDDFNWDEKTNQDYFLYAMLKKQFEFEKAFEDLGTDTFGKKLEASYFGIDKDSKSDELREQIGVLYYNSKDDFAIILKTKQEDEVIICKNPVGDTFNKIYENIEKQTENFEGIMNVEKDEIVKIPNLKLKEKTEFKELQNKPFSFSNGDSYMIEKAMQTIEFELDRKGGKIKSEAGMMVTKNAAIIEPKEKREFIVDDTFAIFLKEDEKDKPYFAGKISDITKFQ